MNELDMNVMSPTIAHQIILKIASRCNLYCNYCHWFRDQEVYKEPKIFSVEIEDFFILRLRSYLERNRSLRKISIVFHGGEPLLFPQARYEKFCEKIDKIELDLGVKLP